MICYEQFAENKTSRRYTLLMLFMCQFWQKDEKGNPNNKCHEREKKYQRLKPRKKWSRILF